MPESEINIIDLESQILDLGDRLDSIQRLDAPFYNLPPFESDPRVPLVENIEKLQETQVVGTTHVVLSWKSPEDPSGIKGFEIWAKRATSQAEQPYKVAEVDDAPAAFSLNSSQDVTIVLYVRTVMRNGLGSDLSSSPTVATSVTIADVDIPDGSITTNKLADFAVTNAKIANTTITNAKIANLAAEKILAGTMTAVNVEAGTYDLISAPNRMRITGSLGFYQLNTTSNEFIQFFSGQMTSGHISNGTGAVIDINTSGSNSVGQFALYSATSGSATERHIMLAGATTSTYTMKNSSGANYIILTVGSTNGSVVVDAASGNNCEMRAGTSGGFYVNSTRVVREQQATIADPAGGGTVDAEARTAINAIIDRLQAHGLIS